MTSTEDRSSRAQYSGVLSKKPVGVAGGKWSKRFFIVKDGFLMYYPDSEKKDYARKKQLNLHPKGVMPLGDCAVDDGSEPGAPFMIQIVNRVADETLYLAADTLYEQQNWLDELRSSTKITYQNAGRADDLIRMLQDKGKQLDEEKQTVRDQLHYEAVALSEEKERAFEMYQQNIQMEAEKAKAEALARELQGKYVEAKEELLLTSTALQQVQSEKDKMADTTSDLENKLQILAAEETITRKQLTDSEKIASQLLSDLESQHETIRLGRVSVSPTEVSVEPSENNGIANGSTEEGTNCKDNSVSTSEVEAVKAGNHLGGEHGNGDEGASCEVVHETERLQQRLQEIETEMLKIKSEKNSAEQRVKEKEELARLLEDEKVYYNNEAKNLQATLKTVTTEKQLTESELQAAIMARIEAEERLHRAEDAIKNLESKLARHQNTYTNEQKQDMVTSVKSLKSYFESVASGHGKGREKAVTIPKKRLDSSKVGGTNSGTTVSTENGSASTSVQGKGTTSASGAEPSAQDTDVQQPASPPGLRGCRRMQSVLVRDRKLRRSTIDRVTNNDANL